MMVPPAASLPPSDGLGDLGCGLPGEAQRDLQVPHLCVLSDSAPSSHC